MMIRWLPVLLLSLVTATLADGLETKRPAVLFDAPSNKAKAWLILSGGYPVRQISTVDNWRKVVTASGDSGWLAAADVRSARRAIIVVNRATVRVDPNDSASPVFYAQRGVVLELLQGSSRWLQVLHPDGESGYIETTAVWKNE